jgi:hypothetical protein
MIVAPLIETPSGLTTIGLDGLVVLRATTGAGVGLVS